jgi:hypothetical protein
MEISDFIKNTLVDIYNGVEKTEIYMKEIERNEKIKVEFDIAIEPDKDGKQVVVSELPNASRIKFYVLI